MLIFKVTRKKTQLSIIII